MQHRSFYLQWLRRALAGAFGAVGVTGRVQVMRGLVLWAATVLILYSGNWQGWPVVGAEHVDVGANVRLALSGIAAIVIVFGVALVWQLIVQPARMYDERSAELIAISTALHALNNTESSIQKLSDLHSEGYGLYKTEADREIWSSRMEDWSRRVEDFLQRQFSVGAVHRFRQPGSGFWIRLDWGWANREEAGGTDASWLLARYSARLNELDSLVANGQGFFLGDKKLLKSLAEKFRETAVT